MKDYYKILEISRDASPEDIKKAYRSLAMKYHPDKSGGNSDLESKFKDISEAYEILGDPQKKASYDQPSPFNGGGFNPFGSSPFENMFKSGWNRSPRGSNGQNINARIMVTLSDIMNGTVKKANIFRRVRCVPCEGSGAKDNQANTCSTCGGSGTLRRMVTTQFGQISMDETCNGCGGEGKTAKSICPSCSGEGTQRIQDSVDVRIPKGSVSGMSFVVPGMGDFPKGKGSPGDLIVITSEIPHNFYRMDGLNLVCHKSISFYQACAGTEIEIPSPKGEGQYKLTIPPGTQPGKVFRLQGRGVPEMGGEFSGDIMVMMDVMVPKNLSSYQMDILKDFDLTLVS